MVEAHRSIRQPSHLPQGALAESLSTSPMGKKKVKKRGRSGFLPYTHDIF